MVNCIIKKNMHVTSRAFHLSTGGQYLGTGSAIKQISINSWLHGEYVAADKCDEFRNLVANSVQGNSIFMHATGQRLETTADSNDEETATELQKKVVTRKQNGSELR